jgi:hypothetical protein
MTVIAWDGKTLAADKRADVGGMTYTTTKLFRVRDAIVGVAGNAALSRAMVEWLIAGADPSRFPDGQKIRDDACGLLVIQGWRVFKYEYTPHPFEIEDRQVAMGSGRDYALCAMRLGKTAAEAVALACEFDPGCGNGIDTLELQ